MSTAEDSSGSETNQSDQPLDISAVAIEKIFPGYQRLLSGEVNNMIGDIRDRILLTAERVEKHLNSESRDDRATEALYIYTAFNIVRAAQLGCSVAYANFFPANTNYLPMVVEAAQEAYDAAKAEG